MTEKTIEEALASRLEPQILAFERNASLWRLEADQHVTLLRENHAFAISDPHARERAMVSLAGIEEEIQRFQRFGPENSPPIETVIRLAEVAVALETARRRLIAALGPLD